MSTEVMDSDKTYIGVVERGNGVYVRLTPLMASSEDGRYWSEDLSRDRSDRFPDKGYVIWFHPPKDATHGTVWSFQIQECDTYRSTTHHSDKYMVVPQSCRRAIELLDLGNLDTEYLLREKVTDIGIRMSHGLNQSVLIRVGENEWLGPMNLIQDEKAELFRYADDQDYLARLPVHRIGLGSYATLKTLEDRNFLNPPENLGEVVGWRNWEPENSFLLHLGNRIRKITPDSMTAMGVTKDLFRDYVQAILEAGLGEGTERDREKDQARLSRIEEFDKLADENSGTVRNIIAALMEKESIRSKLDEERERILREARSQSKEILEQEFSSLKAETEALEERKRKLTSECERLEAQRRSKRQELESGVDSLSEAMERRVREIRDRPLRALEELAEHSALARFLIGEGDSKAPAPDPTDIALANPLAELEPIRDLDALTEKLGKAFSLAGLGTGLARRLQATFLSGTIPILTGGSASRALALYANHVAGGRCLWLPVSPAVVGFEQLFDIGRQGDGKLLGSLETILGQAIANAESLFVVVLRGLDLSPAEHYLPTLLDCYSDAWIDGGAGRRLPLGRLGAALSRRGIGGGMEATMSWPPNVLLAATLEGGGITFPLPDGTWDTAFELGCDLPGEEPVATHPLHPALIWNNVLSSRYAVRFEDWRAWRGECEKQNVGKCVDLCSRFADQRPPSRGRLDCALRVYAAAKQCGFEERIALEMVEKQVLEPSRFRGNNIAASR